MLLDIAPGGLSEPITGRAWDPPEIMRQLTRRTLYYHSRGVKPSARVFIHYGNRLEFFVDLLAIWNLGGCVVPVDPRLTPFEVEVLTKAAGPSHSLWLGKVDDACVASMQSLDVKLLETSDISSFQDRSPALLQNERPLVLDQPALILFTSGTTGAPKGVVHTHRSLRARWAALKQSLGLAPFQRTLCLLPTHFGHGLICNCLFPWLGGQDLFILPSFEPGILLQLGALIDKHAITCLSSVPSVWRLALKMTNPPTAGTLQRVLCGSAPLSAHMWRGIQKWSGTREVINAYGITETGSWVGGTTVPSFIPEDGLIGEPWGAEIEIRKSKATDLPLRSIESCQFGEAGYIWINTAALMQGYLDREDLTRQVVNQGWFLTGDIGVKDERGWLYLCGREREEINKGGMKVYPGDVDAVIEQFETIADVCCFGYDNDPFYGQNVAVAVVFKCASGSNGLESLYQWTKQRLANFQMPVRWYVVDSIPRTARGKVSRAQVAQACAALSPIDIAALGRGA